MTLKRDYVAVANRYIEQVLMDKIPACRFVKMACQRQVDDLSRFSWPDSGFTWSLGSAFF